MNIMQELFSFSIEKFSECMYNVEIESKRAIGFD